MEEKKGEGEKRKGGRRRGGGGREATCLRISRKGGENFKKKKREAKHAWSKNSTHAGTNAKFTTGRKREEGRKPLRKVGSARRRWVGQIVVITSNVWPGAFDGTDDKGKKKKKKKEGKKKENAAGSSL